MGFMELISLPRKGFLRGAFRVNHSESTDNLTKPTKRQNTYKRKLTLQKSGPNKQQKTHSKTYTKREREDRQSLV